MDENNIDPSQVSSFSISIEDMRKVQLQSESISRNDGTWSITSVDSCLSIATLATSNTTGTYHENRRNQMFQNQNEEQRLLEPLSLDDAATTTNNLSTFDMEYLSQTLFCHPGSATLPNRSSHYEQPHTISKCRHHPKVSENIRRRKARFWMMTRILLKFLKTENHQLYLEAKETLRDCALRHRRGISGYRSLSKSSQVSIKEVVGRHYWNQARRILSRMLQKSKCDDTIQPEWLEDKQASDNHHNQSSRTGHGTLGASFYETKILSTATFKSKSTEGNNQERSVLGTQSEHDETKISYFGHDALASISQKDIRNQVRSQNRLRNRHCTKDEPIQTF